MRLLILIGYIAYLLIEEDTYFYIHKDIQISNNTKAERIEYELIRKKSSYGSSVKRQKYRSAVYKVR